MPMLSTHGLESVVELPGGVRFRYRFANGYRATVACCALTRGHEQGLWEMTLRDPAGELSSVPSSVSSFGNLTEDEANHWLTLIASYQPPHGDGDLSTGDQPQVGGPDTDGGTGTEA